MRTRAILTDSRKMSMREATRNEGAKLVRDVAQAFLVSDVNKNHRLSFEEFLRAVPAAMKSMKSEADLRKLFNTVDADGNGSVSIDEFFIWTLSFMKTTKGSGIEEVFRRYDPEKHGILNALEFSHAAEDIGFGEVANDLFIEFDTDNTGTVSHTEVLEIVKLHGISRDAKRLLTEIAFDADRHAVDLDTSSWRLTAETKDGLRAELLVLMRGADPPARISELYRALAGSDGVTSLGRDGFETALSRIGLPPGNHWLADAVFTQMDAKATGVVTERELKQWINGNEIRKALAKQIKIVTQDMDGEWVDLREIEWDFATLREQLQIALISSNLGPLDLLRAWEPRSGEGIFSKRAMLVMMKSFIDDLSLWDDCVRDVVVDTFDRLSGGEKVVGIKEFQRFFQFGWHDIKQSLQGTGNVRRKAPQALDMNISKPPPMYGDPRWPNRIWPARRGTTSYARRMLYRPPPGIEKQIYQVPIPPLLPVSRETSNSKCRHHYATTADAKALRRSLALHNTRGSHRLTHCYFQVGGLARQPQALVRPSRTRLHESVRVQLPVSAFGGPSTTSIMTYKRAQSAPSLRAQSSLASLSVADAIGWSEREGSAR